MVMTGIGRGRASRVKGLEPPCPRKSSSSVSSAPDENETSVDVEQQLHYLSEKLVGGVSLPDVLSLQQLLHEHGAQLDKSNPGMVEDVFMSVRLYAQSRTHSGAIRARLLSLLELRANGWMKSNATELYYSKKIHDLSIKESEPDQTSESESLVKTRTQSDSTLSESSRHVKTRTQSWTGNSLSHLVNGVDPGSDSEDAVIKWMDRPQVTRAGLFLLEVGCHKQKAGSLFGQGGGAVRWVEKQTDTVITVDENNNDVYRKTVIQGKSPHAISSALDLIESLALKRIKAPQSLRRSHSQPEPRPVANLMSSSTVTHTERDGGISSGRSTPASRHSASPVSNSNRTNRSPQINEDEVVFLNSPTSHSASEAGDTPQKPAKASCTCLLRVNGEDLRLTSCNLIALKEAVDILKQHFKLTGNVAVEVDQGNKTGDSTVCNTERKTSPKSDSSAKQRPPLVNGLVTSAAQRVTGFGTLSQRRTSGGFSSSAVHPQHPDEEWEPDASSVGLQHENAAKGVKPNLTRRSSGRGKSASIMRQHSAPASNLQINVRGDDDLDSSLDDDQYNKLSHRLSDLCLSKRPHDSPIISSHTNRHTGVFDLPQHLSDCKRTSTPAPPGEFLVSPDGQASVLRSPRLGGIGNQSQQWSMSEIASRSTSQIAADMDSCTDITGNELDKARINTSHDTRQSDSGGRKLSSTSQGEATRKSSVDSSSSSLSGGFYSHSSIDLEQLVNREMEGGADTPSLMSSFSIRSPSLANDSPLPDNISPYPRSISANSNEELRSRDQFGFLQPDNAYREPVCPLTSHNDLHHIERGMPGNRDDPSSPTARRHAFKRNSQTSIQRNNSQGSGRLSYGKNFLLACAESPVARELPKEWSILTKLHPDVCLPRPANGYFLLEEYCLPLGELLAVKVNSRGDSGSHGNSDSAVSSLRRGGFGKGSGIL